MREGSFDSLLDVLNRRVEWKPREVAYRWLDDQVEIRDSVTVADIFTRSTSVAARLQDAGLKGERALLFFPPGIDFVPAFLGCLAAGVVAVPCVVPRAKKTDRALGRALAIVRDAAPRAVLTSSTLLSLRGALPAEAGALADLSWLTSDDLESEWAERWSPPAVGSGDLAFLQYTSGSTATPKGVMVSHANLLYNIACMAEGFSLHRGTRSVTWLPVFHDMGLIEGVLAPFVLGYEAHLLSPMSFLQRPVRWLEAISRLRATHSGAPNFAFELASRRATPEVIAELDLSSWEGAYSGAEPVRRETMERFAATFAPCGFRREALLSAYGLAEATLYISSARFAAEGTCLAVDRAALQRDRVVALEDGGEEAQWLVSFGREVLETRIVVVNPETFEERAEGEVGELWVGGPTVAQGYWKRPDETAAIFGARLSGSGEGPFLRTGDLGFRRGERFFITGRLKDLIIVRGRNHYPQDVELTVEASHPWLRAGCGAAFSVDVPDGRGGAEERLVVVQELDRRGMTRQAELDEVLEAVREKVVEEHEIEPHAVSLIRTGHIPKTSSGKIQRRPCRRAWLEGELPVVAEWRRSSATASAPERARPMPGPGAAAGRRDVLGRIVSLVARRRGGAKGDVDPHASFARHGLDSMAAVELCADLAEWLGRPLIPTLLYDHPTPHALAAHLAPGPETRLETPGAPRAARAAAGASPGQAGPEPAAIVGIGCRFPGADGPRELWRLLRSGEHAVREAPPERGTGAGGYLDGVDLFDADLFHLSPREAEAMDPQQRLLLEVVWTALEDARVDPTSLAGSDTGVFVGIANGDYARLRGRRGWADDAFTGTGTAFSIAANRLSYVFDLRGPSLAVDTACSSSLVALDLACRSLVEGEASRALVAGVNLMLAPETTEVFARAGFLASGGVCRAFDAAGEGYVRGEGAGAVLLKPLSRALADGDRIYAVVRGTAVNQDGLTNGLTAPSRASQEAVLARAYRRAGVEPRRVAFVEAHGSGTALGDPIEAAALGAVLGPGRAPESPCAIGSIKTNLGHLEAAAGIAGLIKAALALHHGELPPSLHFDEPNPHIPFAELALEVQRRLGPVPRGPDGEAAVAGVSSFGFGGTNAHAVLQAFPNSPEAAEPAAEDGEGEAGEREAGRAGAGEPRPYQILVLSAATPASLDAAAAGLARHLEARPEQELADAAHSLRVGRARLEHRRFLIARSREDAVAALVTGDPSRLPTLRERARGRGVAFLLPGIGDHYPGMGRGLYIGEAVFRRTLDRAAEVLRPILGEDLRELLFPPEEAAPGPPAGVDLRRMLGRGAAPSPSASRLERTAVAHPAVFALEVALARLWESWGVRPEALLGYSVGEYAAACLAGVFSFEAGLEVVARRAALIDALEPGAMLSVSLGEEELAPRLEEVAGEVGLAAVNAPELCVVSGTVDAVEDLARRLEADGVPARRLGAAHPFHTPAMEALAGPVADLLSAADLSAPRIPYLSNATGRWITPEEAVDPAYWVRQMCRPVRFADALARLAERPELALVEVGPGSLASLARQAGGSGGAELTAVPSLRHAYDRQDDAAFLLGSLGRLWLAGVDADWEGFARGEGNRRRVDLPTYAFERRRYWLEEEAPRAPEAGKRGEVTDWFYLPTWRRTLPAPVPSAASSRGEKDGRPWLVFADDLGLAAAAAETLAAAGERVAMAEPGRVFESLGAGEAPFAGRFRIDPEDGAHYERLLAELEPGGEAGGVPAEGLRVAHLWSVGEPPASGDGPERFARASRLGYGSLLALVRALARTGLTAPVSITVVTRDLYRVDGGEEPAPEQAPLGGLARVAAQEYLNLSCRTLDVHLSEREPTAAVAGQLAAELAGPGPEIDVAFRGGDRWALAFEAVHLPAGRPPLLRGGGSYLITGGFGAVGSTLAEHLAERLGGEHGARLTLLGRTELPPEEAWNDLPEGSPAAGRVALVRRLRSLGAEVLPLAADVADVAAVRRAVAAVRERFGALHGVFHAAGVLDAHTLRPIQDLDLAASMEQFRPKVHGAYSLAAALDGVEELDFCLMTSSLTSILGGLQFAAYAAANAFLDAFAQARSRRSGAAWVSMGSDLWDLKEERYGGFGATVLGYRMSPEEGLEVVRRLLAPPMVPHLLVSTGDLSARIRQWLDLAEERGAEAARRASSAPRPRRLATPYAPPETELEAAVTRLWEEVLGIERIGIHDDFFQLGGHSLLATRFASRLRELYPVDLDLRALFDAPTPASLARVIDALLWSAEGSGEGRAGDGNGARARVDPAGGPPAAPSPGRPAAGADGADVELERGEL